MAEQIGLNLRRARRRADLSQGELSRLTGLHHSEISLLERGCRVPRLDTCMKILQSTGADPRGLVDGITWHRPRDWDERGWFSVAGLDEPAAVRPPAGERR